MIKPKKVALAYSGGLDTSVIISWLTENYGCEVVAICGDLGQDGGELTGLEAKARASGAAEVYIEDMREEFASQYLWKLVRSGSVHEHNYLSGASITCPLLARKQVEVALATGCDALVHGCTATGNVSDRIRFDLAYKALAPHLPVIAPWREWDPLTREDAVEFDDALKVPIGSSLVPPQSPAKIYSRGHNIWHISYAGGPLEDPANPAPGEIWMLTKSAKDAPDLPGEVAIEFQKGIPAAVNGKRMKAFELLESLNQLGATHGIGRVDLLENRVDSLKSRVCYETPGGALILFAIRELEALTLDQNTAHHKRKLSLDYAETVYNGLWFTPLREALDAFFEKAAESVTGEVRLRLYKGNIDPLSRKSPYSLCSPGIATFTTGSSYDRDAFAFNLMSATSANNHSDVNAGTSK